jgi:hypothetical protein
LSIRFQATVYQRSTSARIDVPEKVTKAFGETGYIAVSGTMNDVGIRGTLMPAGGGRHVLNINHQMRERAGLQVGDTAVFTLDRGVSTRQPPMSRELAVALDADPAAKALWTDAPAAKRKDVLARLERQRNPEAIAREVERIMKGLRAGKV